MSFVKLTSIENLFKKQDFAGAIDYLEKSGNKG